MERGELVRVRVYSGEVVPRRVWQDVGRGVLLCTEDGYERAIKTGREPVCVGFPRDDIEPGDSPGSAPS